MTADEKPRPRQHADWCEADTGHEYDCSTATRLFRLTALAEAVRDELTCNSKEDAVLCGDVDDCWHCFARQALEQVP
jgi:hypothetical protein